MRKWHELRFEGWVVWSSKELRKSIQSRKNSMYQGPVVGRSMVRARNLRPLRWIKQWEHQRTQCTLRLEKDARGLQSIVTILVCILRAMLKRMTLSRHRICVMIKFTIIAHTQTKLCSKYSVYKCLELWKLWLCFKN